MDLAVYRGIKESILQGSNTKLVFDSIQEKDKIPATWLNRLRSMFQLYSNREPDKPEGQVFLKVQFVTKSWPDIRRKLEKNRGLEGKRNKLTTKRSPESVPEKRRRKS